MPREFGAALGCAALCVGELWDERRLNDKTRELERRSGGGVMIVVGRTPRLLQVDGALGLEHVC